MRDRVMRNIIFFDLPNVKHQDKVNYQRFRKFLINEGFIMMQESVYSKLCLNLTQNDLLYNRIKRNAPRKGLVQLMVVTEKQYSNIEYIVGESKNQVIDSGDRIIIL